MDYSTDRRYWRSIRSKWAEVNRWANDVEKKQENIYELGLAAFAKKNFSEAGARFVDSARNNEHKLQQAHRREQQLTADTIRDYRLAGDSYSNSYDFSKSAEMYERALSLADRRTNPQLWASVSVSCGNARLNFGIRTSAEGDEKDSSAERSGFLLPYGIKIVILALILVLLQNR